MEETPTNEDVIEAATESTDSGMEETPTKSEETLEDVCDTGEITFLESPRGLPEGGEPVFLLRARDPLAVPTLEEYFSKCVAAGCPREYIRSVQERIKEFREFDSEKTKVPD